MTSRLAKFSKFGLFSTRETLITQLWSSTFHRQSFSIQSPPVRCFGLSVPLSGEPLKKKIKVDPMVIKAREDRARGKVQRVMLRLSRFADKLKPVDEFEVPRRLIREREARTRVAEPLTFEESENRARLKREWNRSRLDLHWSDMKEISRVRASQKRALNELRVENEELYRKALETDDSMLSLTTPILTSTPPIIGYEAPDGAHEDVTKTFEYEVEVSRVLGANAYLSTPRWLRRRQEKEEEDDSDDEKDKKKKKKKK